MIMADDIIIDPRTDMFLHSSNINNIDNNIQIHSR